MTDPGQTTAKAFTKNVFIGQERKSGERKRLDTVVVLTVNDDSPELCCCTFEFASGNRPSSLECPLQIGKGNL